MALVILAASLVAAFVFYPVLPARVPSHWNAIGQIDGYVSPFWGAFLFPIMSIVLLAVFIVIPRIDPKRENIEKFRTYLDEFILVLFAFLAYLHLFILLISLYYQLNLFQFLSVGIALLFAAAARLMEHAEPNWTMGILTPWTLSSDSVWHATHVLGAKLFSASAVIALLGLALPRYAIWFVLVPAIASAVASFVYSYVLYGRERQGSVTA